jgi:hypothetical protein
MPAPAPVHSSISRSPFESPNKCERMSGADIPLLPVSSRSPVPGYAACRESSRGVIQSRRCASNRSPMRRTCGLLHLTTSDRKAASVVLPPPYRNVPQLGHTTNVGYGRRGASA